MTKEGNSNVVSATTHGYLVFFFFLFLLYKGKCGGSPSIILSHSCIILIRWFIFKFRGNECLENIRLDSLVSHLKFVQILSRSSFSPFVCYFIKQFLKDSKCPNEFLVMSVKLNCRAMGSMISNMPDNPIHYPCDNFSKYCFSVICELILFFFILPKYGRNEKKKTPYYWL